MSLAFLFHYFMLNIFGCINIRNMLSVKSSWSLFIQPWDWYWPLGTIRLTLDGSSWNM